MELQYLGANCIRLGNKKVSLVVDDNLAGLGLKSVTNAKDIVLTTGVAELPKEAHFKVDMPGEYEVSDISIQGIPARSHMDEEGGQSTTMYRIIFDGLRIVVTGHIHPELTDWQLEALGTVDILLIPVGGNGYTLDGLGAQKVVKEIEPKIVIPTHYADSKINYEVPQAELDDAVKALGMEPTERLEVLKTKGLVLGEGTKLYILDRQ